MTTRGTPSTLRSSGPVFRTPMTFSPRVVGDQARPSPSRHERWMDELGLADTNIDSDLAASSEEELEEIDQSAHGHVAVSNVEFQTLRRELEERDKQRSDLLLKLRANQDKLKQYKSRMHREETNKKQQIKIMRKTHETLQDDNVKLIRNLEAVIKELEDNSDNAGSGAKKHHSTTRLAEQIRHLQQEKADITGQFLTAQAEVEQVKLERKEEMESLRKENSDLQDEVVGLRMCGNVQLNGSTDTEKQVKKLEEENEKLKRDLAESRRLAPKQLNDANTGNEKIKKLEKENGKLKDKLLTMELEFATISKQLADSETKYRDEVRILQRDIQQSEMQVREMRKDLTSLHAKEPQVVTKVERVEVDSEANKKAFSEVNVLNTQLKSQNQSLQQNITECNNQLEFSNSKIKTLEKQIQEHEGQMDIVKSELIEEIQNLEKSKSEAVESTRKTMEQNAAHLSSKYTAVRVKMSLILPQLKEMCREYKNLKKQVGDMPVLMQQLTRETNKKICKAITDLDTNNKDLVRKYHKELKLRKKYHNELVELKGNIRVYCRVRPKISEDGKGPSSECVIQFDADDSGVLYINTKTKSQTFEMDEVFNMESTQEQVFSEVQALVTSCIDGYNVCIFAYGQTGSGKTHTMEGPNNNPGINQRALIHLFHETEDRSKDWEYKITVSVMEIYNEMLRDLLSNAPTFKLDVKMNSDGELFVPGLTMVEVHTVDDVNKTFFLGHTNRSTSATNMNEHSSRSHCLLRVNIVGTNKTTGAKTIGKLNLVDLAGSERVSKSGADGARLKEAQSINKSLSSLGDVISALKSKQSFVPYRNSKLTYLLQDSLGGDSKTLMIVQIAPIERHVSETTCSLTFAQRVRAVELGTASRKTESADITELRERLSKYEDIGIKRSLTPSRGGTPSRSLTPSRLGTPGRRK